MPESAVEKLRPELSDAADEAKKVWNAMGEWKPEALPTLVVLLDVEHVDGLMERLLAIRQGVKEHQEDNG